MTPPAPVPRPTLALIGAGRVGTTLALAAQRCGYTLAAVHTRSPERAAALLAATGAQLAADVPTAAASADLILIAVPDDAIAAVDAAGAGAWRAGSGVVHHSGLHSAALLQHAAAAGARAGALHPLQTIPNPQIGLTLLPGTYFSISGHADLLPTLAAFVADLGGHALTLPDQAKPLYHAAAVFASNYLTTCFAQAVAILVDLGIAPSEAAAALLPLARGAIAGLADPGLPQALTGPISRGDAGVLAIHQRHLAARHPHLLPLYRALAAAALPLAAAQGRLTPATLAALAAAVPAGEAPREP